MYLYIIGNGFDLNHGIKSSYHDYRKYLLTNHPDICSNYENCDYIFSDDTNQFDKWTDIEKSLQFHNLDQFLIDQEEFYPNLSSDSTPGWNDIEINSDVTFSFIHNFVGPCFSEWVNQIVVRGEKIHDIDCDSYFLTFNYTNTLEKIYGIKDNHILHIHGTTKSNNLQFGCPFNAPGEIYKDLENQYIDDEWYGNVYEPAIEKIYKYVNEATKNLNRNSPILIDFLNRIENSENIETIVIMGHSYDGVDKPYYESVLIPKYKNRKWIFYCYNNDDIQKAQDFVSAYNISEYELRKW